jgi:CDP-paratose 2-epimerase
MTPDITRLRPSGGRVLITGGAGFIGTNLAARLAADRRDVVVLDNLSRPGVERNLEWLRRQFGDRVKTMLADVRSQGALRDALDGVTEVFHFAAQVAVTTSLVTPLDDFDVNARGTLTLLEAIRERRSPPSLVFTSTNKVYGDTPNRLPLMELPLRWEIEPSHEYEPGISETMSIDHTKHSLFGASKVAADILVQEYGRYFGMPTACFRGGCLTGPAHAGTELHGFLSYLMKCTVTGRPYRVFGYGGKQVRDNIHSFDLVEAFAAFIEAPRVAEVYNLGGSRHSNCSMLEAIELCEEISGRKLTWKYEEDNRIGDHIWWISDVRKFQEHYPTWKFRYGLREILEEIHEAVVATEVPA